MTAANENRTTMGYLWRQIRLLVTTLLVVAAIKVLPKSAKSIEVAQAFLALSAALRKAA